MDHGAKYDPILLGEIDRGGVINTIVPGKTTLRTCAAWWSPVSWPRSRRPILKTCAVDIRGLCRECHLTAGPCLAGVVEGGA
jgi:hypothetical protein